MPHVCGGHFAGHLSWQRPEAPAAESADVSLFKGIKQCIYDFEQNACNVVKGCRLQAEYMQAAQADFSQPVTDLTAQGYGSRIHGHSWKTSTRTSAPEGRNAGQDKTEVAKATFANSCAVFRKRTMPIFSSPEQVSSASVVLLLYCTHYFCHTVSPIVISGAPIWLSITKIVWQKQGEMKTGLLKEQSLFKPLNKDFHYVVSQVVQCRFATPHHSAFAKRWQTLWHLLPSFVYPVHCHAA